MGTSCSSDDGPSEPIDTNVTFANTIEKLMEDRCTSCHGDPPTNGAPISLVTFDNVKDAVSNNSLISRIENGTMPPGNLPKLSTAEVQAVKDWQDGNFQE